MKRVMAISRHRQLRAWQFGVRNSGLWRKGGRGTSSGGGDDPLGDRFSRQSAAVKVLVVIAAGVVMALLWISGYTLVLLLWLWIIVGIPWLIRALLG